MGITPLSASRQPSPLPPSHRRVDRVLKRFERGEIERVDWLDGLTMRAIDSLRRQHHAAAQQQVLVQGPAAAAGAAGAAASDAAPGPDAAAGTSSGSLTGANSGSNGASGGLQLVVELLTFPQAVVFQQAAVLGHAAPTAMSASTSDALGTPLPGTSGTGVVAPPPPGPGPGSGSGSSAAGGGIIQLNDPEIGRENPAELKAQKLARSVTRGMVDRNLKPDTEERQRISAVLDYPPNRCVQALLGVKGPGQGRTCCIAMQGRTGLW